MKLVKETLGFERGLEPKDAMQTGVDPYLTVGTILQSKYNFKLETDELVPIGSNYEEIDIAKNEYLIILWATLENDGRIANIEVTCEYNLDKALKIQKAIDQNDELELPGGIAQFNCPVKLYKKRFKIISA